MHLVRSVPFHNRISMVFPAFPPSFLCLCSRKMVSNKKSNDQTCYEMSLLLGRPPARAGNTRCKLVVKDPSDFLDLEGEIPSMLEHSLRGLDESG